MAKLLSPVYSIIRGSVAGLTYSANRYAQIIVRARTAPVQPGGEQDLSRNAFQLAAEFWRDQLLDEDRAKWNDYAATCPYNGPIGTYYLDGRTLFMGNLSLVNYCNQKFLNGGVTVPGQAPGGSGWLIFGPPLDSVPSSGTGVAWSVANPNDVPIYVFAERSVGLPTTRNFWKGPWVTEKENQVCLSIAATTTGLVEWTDLLINQRYFVRFHAFTQGEPFLTSTPIILHKEAEAAP